MSNFNFHELKEGEIFDPLTLCPDTPFTQAKFYGQWQQALGREVRCFVIEKDNNPIAYFQLIKYPLIADKSYAYCPFGPVVKEYSSELLKELKTKLLGLAKNLNAVFIRLNFTPVSNQNFNLQRYFTKSLAATYHSAYFQPRVEWFLSLHPRAYYENVFKNLKNIPGSFLVLAKHQEKILVIDVIIVYGNTANYVYGSGSDELRTSGTSFAAQWAALQQAKKIGCRNYNFGGIVVEGIYSGWEGLTRFKKRFGGYEVNHSDFYDLVAKPFWYWLYNLRKLLKKLKG